MEWSLVLASQDIPATILAPNEVNGWRLEVDANDHARALKVLRQYRKENRALSWIRTLPGTHLQFDLSSAAWFFLLILIFQIDVVQMQHMREVGMMDNQAVMKGEWWRLFTATMLHADLMHLAANCTTGFLLLGLAMGFFGSGVGLLAAFLSGVIGNLAGLLVYGMDHRGLGASGMVLGALGLLAGQSFIFWREGNIGRVLILRSLLGALLLLVLLGFNPNPRSDVVAHVAGFIGGFVLGAGISWIPESVWRNSWIAQSCGWLCVILAVLTWGLALQGLSGSG